MDKVDDIYRLVSVHCRFGELWEQRVLLSVQVGFALMFTLGILPRLSAAISWFLYLSLTLRNTWMSYILDRYFHYLLFLSIFLPWGHPRKAWNVTPATAALKLLLCWIYFDAGYGKLMDPLGGWTYGADPLPALDTYARHTLPAQYLYALAGPEGLRIMTPVVVWIELLAMPLAMIGLYRSWKWLVLLAVSLIASMHLGIALCLRNSALLSLVACAPWFLCLPPSADSRTGASRSILAKFWHIISLSCLLAMAAGNVWLYSDKCDQSVQNIWSTLLHNRWNVFVGAEEYVTWEIAPGELQDGSIVDVWGRRNEVNWQLPGDGAPCTATARPGRWRSFPYLAGLEGKDGEALWSYLCKEWDRENKVDAKNPHRHLVRFNFFMLQADVLPNMAFTETRKRLINSFECPQLVMTASTDEVSYEAMSNQHVREMQSADGEGEDSEAEEAMRVDPADEEHAEDHSSKYASGEHAENVGDEAYDADPGAQDNLAEPEVDAHDAELVDNEHAVDSEEEEVESEEAVEATLDVHDNDGGVYGEDEAYTHDDYGEETEPVHETAVDADGSEYATAEDEENFEEPEVEAFDEYASESEGEVDEGNEADNPEDAFESEL